MHAGVGARRKPKTLNERTREALKGRLGEMTAKDRKQLHLRAVQMREAAQRASKKPAGPIEEWTARLLGLDAAEPARVLAAYGNQCLVQATDGPPVRVSLPRGTRAVVGDEVVLKGERITDVLPRRTELRRPDPSRPGGHLVVAANVDRVLVVASVAGPPFRPRLIDRILVAVRQGGATPAVVLNKLDAGEESERQAAMERLGVYASLGTATFAVSAQTGDGLAPLREEIAGQVSVLVGHSGVGKSSLLNALAPEAEAVTGHVQRVTGKGRHTTTSSSLHRLPGGGCIIDTPGIRSFGIDGDARDGFPEFDGERCRFGDCRHLEEEGCGVREAVRAGRIPHERYEAYRRMAGDEASEGDFSCVHCGCPVSADGGGTRHRNHCPRCLWSRHLDQVPGDRAAACGSPMEPIGVWVRDGGEWALVHRCRGCGALSSNRVAADDSSALLLSIAARPLASPPFDLEHGLH